MITIDKTSQLIIGFASFKFLFHVLIAAFAGYGIFRDELYYVACSMHPAFGYVDHPPMSIWILKTKSLLLISTWPAQGMSMGLPLPAH